MCPNGIGEIHVKFSLCTASVKFISHRYWKLTTIMIIMIQKKLRKFPYGAQVHTKLCRGRLTMAAESCVYIRSNSRTCFVRVRGRRVPRVRRHTWSTRSFSYFGIFVLLKIRLSKLWSNLNLLTTLLKVTVQTCLLFTAEKMIFKNETVQETSALAQSLQVTIIYFPI